MKCKQCEKEFTADRDSRQFCSNECRLEAKGHQIRNKISLRTWQKIIKRAFPNWHCPLCEEHNIIWDDKFWSYAFEAHHITPVREGGSDELDNLILLCPNHHKMADGGVFSKERLKQKSIASFFSEEEFLSQFYYGKNNSKGKRPKSRYQRDLKLENIPASKKVYYKHEKIEIKCARCGELFGTTNHSRQYCSRYCSNENKMTVDRPSKEKLEELLRDNSFVAVGKMFGVSDNAIRKWAKKYGLPNKRGEWKVKTIPTAP